MWKTITLAGCALSLFFVLANCSTSKGVQKPKPSSRIEEADLLSQGEEAIQKRLGKPTTISRTPEGHILWIYEPSWKLMPNDKGTRYVEFDNGHVVRVFKIK
jgi:hypothetical protein